LGVPQQLDAGALHGVARSRGSRGRALAASAFAAALAALHTWSYRGAGPVDDDFIIHRYARNLLEGHAFAFNPGGEVAEGFSAPLWLGVSAGAQALGFEPALGVSWVLVVGMLAAAVSAFVVTRVVASDVEGAGGSLVEAVPFGLAVALSPALAFHAAAGLGTVVVSALLVSAFAAWRSAERRGVPAVAAGCAFGLAALVRQEVGLVWLPFVMVEARRYGVKRALCAALPGALALLGWCAARWWIFGSWTPVTHAVKRLPWLVDLGYGARYAWAATLDAALAPLVVVAALAACTRRLGGPTRAMAAGVGLYAAFIVFVGGDWMHLARFFVPVLPLAIVCAGLLARQRLGRRGVLAAGVTLCALLQVGQRQRVQVIGEHGFFEARWAELGDHFKVHAAPGARVALAPIGVFGWRSRLPLVDLLGLTHRQLVDVAPDIEGVRVKGHHRHSADWVLADPPEFMLLGNGVLQPATGLLAINPWERDLVADPRFRASYVHVRSDVAGRPAEWFRRRDVTAFPGERAR